MVNWQQAWIAECAVSSKMTIAFAVKSNHQHSHNQPPVRNYTMLCEARFPSYSQVILFTEITKDEPTKINHRCAVTLVNSIEGNNHPRSNTVYHLHIVNKRWEHALMIRINYIMWNDHNQKWKCKYFRSRKIPAPHTRFQMHILRRLWKMRIRKQILMYPFSMDLIKLFDSSINCTLSTAILFSESVKSFSMIQDFPFVSDSITPDWTNVHMERRTQSSSVCSRLMLQVILSKWSPIIITYP